MKNIIKIYLYVIATIALVYIILGQPGPSAGSSDNGYIVGNMTIHSSNQNIINGQANGSINVTFKEKSGESQWASPVIVDRGSYQVTIHPQSLKWNGQTNQHTNLVDLVVNDNIATYPGKFDSSGTNGIDLRFIYYGNKLKEELVIASLNDALLGKNAGLGDILTFTSIIRAYDTQLDENLPLRTRRINFGEGTGQVETDEEVLFIDEDNITIFKLPKAKIYDSNGKIFYLNYSFDTTSFNNLKIEINVPYEWLADETRIYPVYLDPSVEIDQEINFISYSDNDFNLNITLFKNITGEFENNINDLFVFERMGSYKFGANDSSINETMLEEYKYFFDSDKSIEYVNKYTYFIKDRTKKQCGSFLCNQDKIRKIDLTDICETRLVLNESQDIIFEFEPKCKIFHNDTQLVVIFYSNSFIDPEIVIGEASSYVALLQNLTAEANLTHLSIDSGNAINSSNILIDLPMDVNISTTTIYDYSSNDNDGTITNNVYFTESGFIGGGYDFIGGGNDYITFGVDNNIIDAASEFTISVWVKADSASGNLGIAREGNNMLIRRYSNVIQFASYVGSELLIVGNTNVADTNWHHIVFVYNTSDLVGFVDGSKQTSTQSASGNVRDSAGTSFILGQEYGSGLTWNGQIDELIVLNKALSDSQITTLYQNATDKYFEMGLLTFPPINISQTGYENALNVTIGAKSRVDFGSNLEVRIGEINSSDYDDAMTGSVDLNIIAWYHMDNRSKYGESASQITDFSGQGNNITSINNPTVNNTDGQYYGSYNFIGSGNMQVNLNSPSKYTSASIDEGTISMWLNSPTVPGGDTPYILSRLSSRPYIRLQSSGRVVFNIYTGSTHETITTPLSAMPYDEWVHVVFVWGTSTDYMRIYVNGISVVNNTYSGTYQFSSDGNWYIGDASTGGSPYQGLMDELMFWNRSLTASEVEELYVKGQFNPRYSDYFAINGSNNVATFNITNVSEATTYVTTQFKVTGGNGTASDSPSFKSSALAGETTLSTFSQSTSEPSAPVSLNFTITYPDTCTQGDGCTSPGCNACTYCSINFLNPDQTLQNCTGQNSTTPFFTFNNTGNVSISLTWTLNASLDSTLELQYDNDSDPSGSIAIPNPPGSVNLTLNLTANSTYQIWLWGNVSSGIEGNTSYNLTAESSQA